LGRNFFQKVPPPQGKTFFEKKVSLNPFQKTFRACGSEHSSGRYPTALEPKAPYGFLSFLFSFFPKKREFFSPEKKMRACEKKRGRRLTFWVIFL
jgi:hypothetical protein